MGAGGIDTEKLKRKEDSLMRGTIRYLFPDRKLRAWEIGADIDNDGTGAFSFSRRWVWNQNRFRPYEKVGVGILIDPDDELGTFLRYQHYQLRGAVGFEQLIGAPWSLRMELEGSASARSFQVMAYAGLTCAW